MHTAGMKREDTNEIVIHFESLSDPPLGMKYQECFDLETGKPSRGPLEIYNKVKRELEELGLEFWEPHVGSQQHYNISFSH